MRSAWSLDRLGNLERPIVQRQNVVATGLDPPSVDQLAQFLWFRLCEVVDLGEVRVDLVELPLIVRPIGSASVSGDRLPAIRPDPAMAEHFKVLGLLR